MADKADIRRFEAHVERLMRTVDRLEDAEVRELLRNLRDARRALDDRIAAELARVDPSRFTLAQSRQMREEIRRVVASTWGRYAARLPASDRAVVDAALGAGAEGLAITAPGRIVGGATLSPELVVTSQRYRAMLISRSDAIGSASSEQVERLSRIVSNGILQGDSPAAISRSLATSGWLGPLQRGGALVGVGARADRIARTEVNRVFNVATQSSADRLAETAPALRMSKIWQTAEDERVRPTHKKAGQRYAIEGDPGPIPVDEDFQVGGFPAAFPQDPRLPAEESVNCRCRSVNFSRAFLDEERKEAA